MRDRGQGATETSRGRRAAGAVLPVLGLTLSAALGLALVPDAAEARARIRVGASARAAPVRPTGEPLGLRPTTLVVPVASVRDPAASPILAHAEAPTVTGAVTRSVLDGAGPALSAGQPPGGIPSVRAVVPVSPEAAPPAKAAAVKVAEPWCRTGRVAGTGAGFCLMN